MTTSPRFAPPRNIFDPAHERDACGVGFVADVEGRPTHDILETAVHSLCRVRHRGALDADSKTGDGAGILTSLPRDFFAAEASALGAAADPDFIGVAMTFVWGAGHRAVIEEACRWEGIEVIAWRPVPVDLEPLGDRALATKPLIEQAIFLKPIGFDAAEAERRCVRARKRAEKACAEKGIRVYFPSFSFSTLTYKGMVTADRLGDFYTDLRNPAYKVPLAVFHQRFSTNTLPTWERTQPFRMLCHNGEINTIQGNVNRMRAREGRLGRINLLEEELLRPVIDIEGSDSAMLDNVLELLTREGRDVRHAAAMLIPAAWENMADLEEEVRDFYRYHACLMEAWDGPAGVIFTDGIRVGACLDRNGLRPLRYVVCEDGMVACTSEAGSVYTRGHGRVRRGKLGPGQMICVDPTDPAGGFENDPVRRRLAKAQPYGQWVSQYLKPAPVGDPNPEIPEDLVRRQVAFGYSHEDFTTVIRPMAMTGHEPTSSMGDDTAPGGLADHGRPVYNYFKQRFAQVTNPPIDALRERSVMSIRTLLGPHDPVLWERPESAAMLELETFLLFKAPGGHRIDATFRATEGPGALREAIERVADEAEHAAGLGSGLLVLTDARVSSARAPIPMLLAVGAVHQRLLHTGQRTRVSIVAETDEAREVHHMACLLGYGAEAICPRLVLASIAEITARGRLGEDIPVAEALLRYRNAVEEGVLKIMSKMGISTTDSYRGAQIFDAIGLGREVIDLCFTGCATPLGGIGLQTIAEDVLARHQEAYEGYPAALPKLKNPGYYKFHAKGIESHVTNPDVVEALQAAVKDGDWEAYSHFAKLVAERPPVEPRDLLEIVAAGPAIPVDEVEPALAITRRFSSGAISHGAIGAEAHETIAQAMNLVGGKANTGEGGEHRSRYDNDKNCRIKQIASGRFGVTPEYCSFAEELNIKMAQGSKPGEGGQIPGKKVTEEIAALRHTQPGVALISPPPHHDIYSIEDLAQLIFDLKQVNPAADVSVKLVSEAGVGTIAAGVTKALADVVQICGWDGGTGASPLSSIKNAGLPWEIGLAETQQILMENGLRDRVRVRMDGGLKSGRDVLVAALLGADEYSFGTSLLLAEGCIMVRACHRDTCPVGIATQRKDLREKFAGTPEAVARYLLFVAEEVRRLLASLGMRSVDDAIGRVDLLRPRPLPGHRAHMLDLSMLMEAWEGPRHFVASHPIQKPRSELGDRLWADAFEGVMAGKELSLSYPIHNSDRTIGARLGGAIAHVHGAAAPPGKVHVEFTGEAGQSFGAFLTSGIEFRLVGEANDYVGKGMGGGEIVILPPENDAGDPYLIGNTVLYGATGGELLVAGRAGERFCVRNSGATAVVEGAGDHACEYMTGGTAVILGPTGWNLGAGMTGGQAYVYDPDMALPARVNPELVTLHHPDGPQLAFLRNLVARHAELTGSSRSSELLEHWRELSSKFWRIAPKAEVARIESGHEGSVEGAKA
ncbi:MAG TPA: glutamate synthase large subunit [Actinomycetota bacterium]|nr:glutamate synthase large subunit [Actinomycetota bacterium]